MGHFRSCQFDSFKSVCNLSFGVTHSDTARQKVGYDTAWAAGRSWLHSPVEDDTTVMMCELCTLYKPSSASKCCWDDYGCRTLRRDRVTEHEGSAQHVAAVRASMSTPVNFYAQLDVAQQVAEDEAPNNSVHNNSQFPSNNSMPPPPLLLKPSTPLEQPPSSRCTCIVLPLTIPP